MLLNHGFAKAFARPHLYSPPTPKRQRQRVERRSIYFSEMTGYGMTSLSFSPHRESLAAPPEIQIIPKFIPVPQPGPVQVIKKPVPMPVPSKPIYEKVGELDGVSGVWAGVRCACVAGSSSLS